MNDAGSWWLEPSPVDQYPRSPQLNGSSAAFDHQINSPSAFNSSLWLQISKSVGTTFVILASANALAGATTAAGIYWDCYRKSRRKDPGFRFKSSFWKLVGPAEIFPFMLSLSIVGQGIVFAVVQSFGLHSSLTLGCKSLSQMLLPSFLMIPYMYFTFGVEATIQALRPRSPFSPRNKWGFEACLAIALLGSVGTYVLTRFVQPPDFCFASFIFSVWRWALGCFGILVGIAFTLLLGSGIIFYRLYQEYGIGEEQRATASWMASFMVLGASSMTIIAPSFLSTSADDGSRFNASTQQQLSMAAAVIVNLSGITIGILYVALRSTKLGKIGPKGYYEFDSRRSVRSPSTAQQTSFVFTKQMEHPVPMPAKIPTHRVSNSYDAPGNVWSLARAAPDANNDRHGGQNATTTIASYTPPFKQQYAQKNSYNLSSRHNVGGPELKSMLPATSYAPSNKDVVSLNHPFAHELPFHPTTRSWEGKHNRASSSSSSATIPIGLRISNINNLPFIQPFHLPASTQYTKSSSRPPKPSIPSPLNPETNLSRGINKQLPPVPLALKKTTHSSTSPPISIPKTVLKASSPKPYPRSNGMAETPSRVHVAEWI